MTRKVDVGNMRKNPLLAATAALSIAGLSLTGCSIAAQKENEESKDKTVTIITHDSFELTKEQIKKFESESGYKLKTTSPGDASSVVNQLLLAEDKAAADGFYGVDNLQAGALTKKGVVEDYVPENLPEAAKKLTNSDALTPIDQGQVCINADAEWFKKNKVELPKTTEDLTKPEYAKLLVAQDPAQSSPGFAFMVATMHQTSDWKKAWEDMLAGGTKVVASWSNAYNTDFSGSEGKGKYPLVVSYSSSPAYEGGKTVNIDATCIDQVEYAGVLKGAKNPEGAKAFVDFMLSDEMQNAIPEQMYMYPVNPDAKLPEEWATHAPLSKTSVTPDPSEIAEKRDEWIKEFRAIAEKN